MPTRIALIGHYNPRMHGDDVQPRNHRKSGWLNLPHMRYPNEYAWFLLVSSLDIMLTWAIKEMHGTEVNPIANIVIEAWGLPGAIVFKFSLTLLVIIVCEVVGRQRDRMARNLSQIAVLISAAPVVYSIGLLTWHRLSGE